MYPDCDTHHEAVTRHVYPIIESRLPGGGKAEATGSFAGVSSLTPPPTEAPILASPASKSREGIDVSTPRDDDEAVDVPSALRSLVKELDPSQRVASCFDIGTPLLLQAGAGSGKTQTIAVRIAFLMLSGVPARSILGICFTRQAAETLRQRVRTILPDHLQAQTWVLKLKTLHAFGLECLRRYLPRGDELDVYNAGKQRDLAKRIVQAYAPEEKSSEAVDDLINYINHVKTKKMMPLPQSVPTPGHQSSYLFGFYERKLHDELRAVDFGDLQRLFYAMLKPLSVTRGDRASAPSADVEENMPWSQGSTSEVPVTPTDATAVAGAGGNPFSQTSTALEPSPSCAALREQFTHIVVDEFQDFNEVQLEILCLLAGDACHVTCVGDPNQCIYGWRGALPMVFSAFKKRFPQTELRTLGVNYRSDRDIVLALNKLVHSHQEAFRQRCNRKIRLLRCEAEADVEDAVPHLIDGVLREQNPEMPYSDIAILCRKRKGVEAFTNILRRRGIPANAVKGVMPDSIHAFKGLLAYLRLCLNPHSDADVRTALCCGPSRLSARAAKDLFFSLQATAAALQAEQHAPICGRHAADESSTPPDDPVPSASGMRGLCPTAYSFYSILTTVVSHDFHAPHLPKITIGSKAAQKTIRQFVQLLVEARRQLEAPWGDVAALIRLVSMRGGCEVSLGATRVVQKRQRYGVSLAEAVAAENSTAAADTGRGGASCTSASAITPQAMAAVRPTLCEDAVYTTEEEINLVHEGEMTVPQLLQCAYEQVVMAVKAEAPTASSGAVSPTPSVLLRRVLDQFMALAPSDDFGPLSSIRGGLEGPVTTNTRTREESDYGHRGIETNSVSVCTVHRAKGMEWPVVILPECWLGNFPVRPTAEERRVFYVAMSRAMTDLVLVTASGKEDHLAPPPALDVDAAARRYQRSCQETPYVAEFYEEVELWQHRRGSKCVPAFAPQEKGEDPTGHAQPKGVHQ